MRTGLWMALVILVLVLGLGLWAAQAESQVAQTYDEAGQALLSLAIAQDWSRAEALLNETEASWQNTLPWLNAVANHADAELVTAAITELRAGIIGHDVNRCISGALGLSSASEGLWQNDALRLENVL